MPLFIGLMSGTSMDGIDAALAEITEKKIEVIGALTAPYSAVLSDRLRRIIQPSARISLHEFASLDVEIGRAFASAANQLLIDTDIDARDVSAIGSHGQTLRHCPEGDPPYTIQVGDPASIAARCSITTVADFRSLDIASGGQGAPLVPAFHEAYFRTPDVDTIVLNIGGIANITILPADLSRAVEGFDTGPGNCLLDDWIRRQHEHPYDRDGHWAASGNVSDTLFDLLMSDDFVSRLPPKSTGREHYNDAFLDSAISTTACSEIAPQDVQATLVQFTVASIAEGIARSKLRSGRVLICGGGAKNGFLIHRLRLALQGWTVLPTAEVGIDPDMVEALAFAWLARQRIEMRPVQLTTGSLRPRLLGAVYEP